MNKRQIDRSKFAHLSIYLSIYLSFIGNSLSQREYISTDRLINRENTRQLYIEEKIYTKMNINLSFALQAADV